MILVPFSYYNKKKTNSIDKMLCYGFSRLDKASRELSIETIKLAKDRGIKLKVEDVIERYLPPIKNRH